MLQDKANRAYISTDNIKSSDISNGTEKPNKIFPLHTSHLKYIAITLLLITVTAIVTSVTLLSLGSTCTSTIKPEEYTNYVDENASFESSGSGALVEKKKWGGRKALNFTVPLAHPTPFVIISHTASPFCYDFSQCSKRVEQIQKYHVSNKSPDIGYNFLIGGDGNAYVGRGWDIRNFHSNNSIGISFIGNFFFDQLTPEMIKIAQKILALGVREGKLSRDYKLIAHNQTYATISPGKHVYKVIKTWPHFDSGDFFNL